MWDYQDLQVWRRARALVRPVYVITAGYSSNEKFGLVAQTRRASVSVAANLAEGSGRRGSTEFARFVDIATGSAYEVECHLLLAHDLSMLGEKDFEAVISELDQIKRMLIGLSRALRTAKAAD